MEVVGRYGRRAESRGLAEAAACHCRSVTSSFLLAMQGLGRYSLGDVTEDDVLAYFAGESGGPAYSSAVSGPIARVLSSDLGDLSAEASRMASYVAVTGDGRKNVQYLTPEEVGAVRQAIGDGSPPCLRDRAMGTLMLHTGLRASEGEPARFFGACDSIAVSPHNPRESSTRRVTCPAFFRLLHGSGIRTTEARLLMRGDVDLEHGVLDIRRSKGHDQHYVALRGSKASVLRD